MKKVFLYIVMLVAAVACYPVEVESDLSTMVTETISGTYGPSTKATIANEGASFKWSVGDNIAVHVSNGNTHKYVFTSDQGASGASQAAASASFTVVYEEGYTRDAFAVYPSTIVSATAANYGQSGATLDVTLPDSYTLAQVTDANGETSPCPMMATNDPAVSGWEFYQLCSLLRLTVSNIPATAKRLEIDFDGKQVYGDFSIANPIPGESVIVLPANPTEADKAQDIIKITKDGTDAVLGATSLVLNIPLPVGTYSNISIYAYDALTGGAAVMEGTATFAYNAVNTKGVKKAVGLINPPYKIRITNNSTELTNVRFVRIFSCQNKLHNGATTYGPFTMSSTENLPSPIQPDLTFDPVTGDQIAFQVVDANGNVYSALTDAPLNKNATVEVKRYTFTVTATNTKVCFSPGDLGLEIINSQSVYSFTEPFTTWGHGNTSQYNTADEAANGTKYVSAITQRVWFDFYFESGLENGTVYGITDWRIPKRAGSDVASYEWNYLVKSRTMNSGVERYYKVTISGHQYCLLLPPDETQSSDIGEDLTSGNVTDYAKYLGKGFVLLFNTNRGSYASNKWSWGSSTSSYAKQGWYWTVYNSSNRYYFTWPDAGPKVDWGSNRMRNHIRYVHNVQ